MAKWYFVCARIGMLCLRDQNMRIIFPLWRRTLKGLVEIRVLKILVYGYWAEISIF